jgi:hypothetical protein
MVQPKGIALFGLQGLRTRNGGASVVRSRISISDDACLPPSVWLHAVRLSSHCLFGDDADRTSPIIHAPSAPTGIPTGIREGSAAVPGIEAGIPRVKAHAGCDRGSVERSTPAPIRHAACIRIERTARSPAASGVSVEWTAPTPIGSPPAPAGSGICIE